MSAATVTLHTAIIDTLRSSEARPLDLLRRLAQVGFADSEVKEAVSSMLREGEIELTSHRLLKLAANTSI